MITLPQATELLARRLAEAEQLPVEISIRQALEFRARAAGVPIDAPKGRDTSPTAIARRKARFDEIAHRIAAMPVRDPRSPKEILDDLNEL